MEQTRREGKAQFQKAMIITLRQQYDGQHRVTPKMVLNEKHFLNSAQSSRIKHRQIDNKRNLNNSLTTGGKFGSGLKTEDTLSCYI
jgi:hypothetical protein